MRSLNTRYFSRLDHLRFFAAGLVLIYHYFHQFIGNIAFKNPFASLVNEGHMGIGLFMVLSGFIFSMIAQGKRIHYGGFIYNRLVRIYPLYTFAVVLAVTLMVYNHNQSSRGIIDILGWLLAFRPPTIVEVPYFPHLWTIPVEFSFYLLFPFLHHFFTQKGLRYFLGLMLFLLIIRTGVYIEYGSVRFLAYETLFGRLDQFLIGYVCGWLYYHQRGQSWLGFPAMLLVAATLVLGAASWLNQHGGSPNMTAWWWTIWPLIEGLCWASLVLSYMYCRLPIPKKLDTALAAMGERSFSIYIVHLFIVMACARHIGLFTFVNNEALNVVINGLLTALPLTLLIASLSFAIIERPFLSFRRVYVR